MGAMDFQYKKLVGEFNSLPRILDQTNKIFTYQY